MAIANANLSQNYDARIDRLSEAVSIKKKFSLFRTKNIDMDFDKNIFRIEKSTFYR